MWTVQDAKNKFSAVVEAALAGTPQEVTRRGRPLSLAATEMLTSLRHEMNESPGVVVPRPVSTHDGKGARKR